MILLRGFLFWFGWVGIAILAILFFIFQLNMVLIANSPSYEKFYRELLMARSGLDIGALELTWQKGLPELKLQEASLNTTEISLNIAKVSITPSLRLWRGTFYQLTLTDGNAIIANIANSETESNFSSPPNIRIVNFTISSQQDPALRLLVKEGRIQHQSDKYLVGLRGDIAYGEDVLARVESTAHLAKELPLSGNFYIQTQHLLLPEDWLAMADSIPLPANTQNILEDLHSIRGDGRLWISMLSGEITEMKADMLLKKVILTNNITIEDVRIRSKFEAFSQDPTREWLWHIGNISLRYEGKELAFYDSYLIKRPSSYEIYAPSFNGGAFASLIVPFIEDSSIRAEIADRQLSGQLHDLYIEINRESKEGPLFLLDAYLDRVTIAAYQNMPAITGLSGQLHIEDTRGWLKLDAAKSSLHLTNLYNQPFQFSRAQGFFAWDWLPEQELVLIGDMDNILNESQQATLDLWMHIVPFKHDYIDLVVGLRNSSFNLTKSYLPDRIMDERLVEWLNTSLQQGNVVEAALAISGDLKSFGHSQTLFELLMNMENVTFKHSADMPALTTDLAQLILDKQDLATVLPSGGRIGNMVTMYKAASRLELSEANLHIKGSGNASMAGIMNLLTLYGGLSSDVLSGWQLGGSLGGDWQFSYDLANQEITAISFAAQLKDGMIGVPFLATPFEQGQGTIGFSMQEGYGGSLTAKLGNETLIGNFHSSAEKNHLTVAGQVNLADHIPTRLREYISGESTVIAALSRPINGSLMFNRIEMSSSLEGTTLRLPAPLYKAANAPMPLSYQLDMPSGARHKIVLADVGELAWRYEQNSVRETFVNVNSTLEPRSISTLTLSLDSLSLTAWEDTIASLYSNLQRQQETEEIAPTRLISASLNLQEIPLWNMAIKKLEWRDKLYQGISINYNRTQDAWIHFSSQHMAGKLLLRSDICHIDISDLHLAPSDPPNGNIFATLPDKLPSFSFAAMPDIIVSLPHIVYDNSPLGHAGLNITFAKDEMNVTANAFMTIPINLAMRWKSLSPTHSLIELNISAQGVLTRPLGPIVESEDLSFTTNLVWQGRNDSFGDWRKHIKGNVNLNIKDGFFISQQTTLLTNLFSLLSLANLQKRFRADFSDLSETSVSFDLIKANMLLTDGKLIITDDAKGEFAFAAILVTGHYDLVNRSLNYEAVVSSPVTKVLPLTALLLGASSLIPLLFSLDFTSSDFLTRFSTAVYQVSGPLNEPRINLVRISDLSGEEITTNELLKRMDVERPLRNLRF